MSDRCNACGEVYKNYAGLVLHKANCINHLKAELTQSQSDLEQANKDMQVLAEALIWLHSRASYKANEPEGMHMSICLDLANKYKDK